MPLVTYINLGKALPAQHRKKFCRAALDLSYISALFSIRGITNKCIHTEYTSTTNPCNGKSLVMNGQVQSTHLYDFIDTVCTARKVDKYDGLSYEICVHGTCSYAVFVSLRKSLNRLGCSVMLDILVDDVAVRVNNNQCTINYRPVSASGILPILRRKIKDLTLIKKENEE